MFTTQSAGIWGGSKKTSTVSMHLLHKLSVRLSMSDTDSVASGAKPKPKGSKCGDCASFVTKRECGVLCEICETGYHAKCEKVQDDTYEFLKRNEGVHWFCKNCDKGLVKMFKAMTKLNDKQLELEGKQSALESEVNRVKEH